jgi:HD-GYP domain-containing protein (c-di-GMP phosphodiesterase class II)
VPTYTVAVAAAAVGVIALGWRIRPLSLSGADDGHTPDVVTIGILIILGWLSMRLRERDTGDQVSLSFTSVVILSAAPLIGPAGAGIVGAVVPLLDSRRRRFSVVQVFNAAMTSFMAAAGGVVYVYVGGLLPVPQEATPTALLVRVALPLLAADIAVCLINAGVLAGMVHLTGGDFRRFISGAVRETVPLYLGYTVICFLFVVLWVPAGVGWLSALLITAPLLVARWVYAQYGEELRAHTRVLDTLVTASDDADGAGTAHGQRVDALVAMIGKRLMLNARDSRSLHYAAALHDIGRLGVPLPVTRIPIDSLTRQDIALIARHPLMAEEMVRGIGFLSGAALAIRHHHERFDGLGYPDGLAGDDIPELARMLAVADALDALTSPGGSVPPVGLAQALEELRRLAGTQLDPRLVALMVTAIEEDQWRPSPAPASRPGALAGGWRDHDHPRMSGRIAQLGPLPRLPW